MNFANVTLGELLSHTNDIIKRNALSILKQLQRERDAGVDPLCMHVVTVAEYEHKKLKGYRCTSCTTLVPVNPQYQKNKKNTLSPSR